MVFGLAAPTTGLDALQKGFGFDSGLMKEILARKQLAQQMQIHQDQLAMQKAAAARASQAASDAHRLAMMKLDPNREINELKRLIAAFGAPKEATEQASYIPSIAGFGNTNQSIPSIDDSGLESSVPSAPVFPSISYNPDSFIPSYNDPTVTQREQKPQQLESFIQNALQQNNASSMPQINDQAVSDYDSAQSKANGIDMEAIKNSPILRGWFKKKFGFDPGAQPAQTPEEKLQEKLRLHQENRLFDIEHPNTTNRGIAQTNEQKAANHYKALIADPNASKDEIEHAKAAWDAASFGRTKQIDQGLAEHRKLQEQRAHWNSKTQQMKDHDIAVGQGAGFSGDETQAWLESGKTLKDLLFQHGYKNESDIEPIYQLTKANQTQYNNQKLASKEAAYLSNFIKNATGDYAYKVKGYSPSLIRDQLSGKNEDAQARYLAARGLAPELINLRLVLANAKSTVAAQNQLREKAMTDMKVFEPLVSAKTWTKMQDIMDNELQNMFKQSRKGFDAPAKSYPTNSQKAPPPSVKGTKIINGVTYYPDGQGGWEHD